MPLDTIASASRLISASLGVPVPQPKWFQLFQPIGGVRAKPLPLPRGWTLWLGSRASPATTTRTKRALTTPRGDKVLIRREGHRGLGGTGDVEMLQQCQLAAEQAQLRPQTLGGRLGGEQLLLVGQVDLQRSGDQEGGG